MDHKNLGNRYIPLNSSVFSVTAFPSPDRSFSPGHHCRYRSCEGIFSFWEQYLVTYVGCTYIVECQTWRSRDLGLESRSVRCCAPRSTQPSIPQWSVNE